MKTRLLILASTLALHGCGLAGTAATGATGAAAEVQQAQQAQQTEQRAAQQVQDAVKADSDQRAQAEKDSQ